MHALDARINMVKQQLRTWQVTDDRLVHLIETLPRERFVPLAYQSLAYSDYAIPLNNRECMLSPKIVGKALQLLDIQPNETVLEIGTGTGYVTALLAHLGKHVYSIEIDPALYAAAESNLPQSNYKNVTLEQGDAHSGWKAHAEYDCMLVTGSYPIEIPDVLKAQVRIGGRIFGFVGVGSAMKAFLYTRQAPQHWITRSLFETSVPALVNVKQPHLFDF